MEDVKVDLLPIIPLLGSLLHRQRPHRRAQSFLDVSTSQREPLVGVLVHEEDAMRSPSESGLPDDAALA